MGSVVEPVGVGVVGCGRMARELARRCAASGRARIAAVWDPDSAALKAAAGELAADAADSAEALCAHPDVGAVLIGSPPNAHCENVLAGAAAGKPVFCEKPLGLSSAECDRMIAACREASVSLFVGHVLRLLPLFRRSLEIVRSGRIGEPRAVSITRAGYSELFAGGWRISKAVSGGLLMEINAHELDYARVILGEPTEVFARTDNILGRMDYEDQAFVLIGFRSGATAALHSSASSPTGEYRVHVQGTRGSLSHGGFGGSLVVKTLDGEREEVTQEQVGGPNGYDAELAAWLDTVTLGVPPLFTGEDGRAAVAMAEAAYRSVELRRVVTMEEV